MRQTRHRRTWHLGLVGRFALASGVVFVLIAVGLSMFASKDLRRQAERSAQFHAVFVTDRVMRYALEDAGTGDDFGQPLPRRPFNRLDVLVRSRILQDPVERVKVYAPNGLILYSDEPRLVGKRFPGEPDGEVLEGAVVSEVTDLDEEENLFERSIAPRLYSTYTPLWFGSATTGTPDVVVEIYQDYGAIQAEADAFFRSRLLSFGVALVLLYVALLPIVLNASRALRKQNVQLEEQARRLEALLAREQRTVAELRRLNKMQSDFAAVASHELRTPLTAIIGYVKTLKRPEFENDPVAREEFLGAIERQSERLFRLITNMLAAAQLEHHGSAVEVVPFDLASLVEEVAEGFHDSGSRLDLRIPSDGPDLESDRVLVGGILANLIDNALKYSATDTPVVVTAGSTAGQMEITVHDSGVGIAPEEQQRIFERFYQSDQSATRRFGGVGLGLHLVRELIQTLGGTIQLESQPGVGTTFTVRLPLRSPATAGAPAGAAQPVAAGH